jgi:hypothetical protein
VSSGKRYIYFGIASIIQFIDAHCSAASRTGKQAAMSPILRKSIFAVLLALGLVLGASPLLAGLEFVHKFVTGNTELDVATYTKGNEKVGLLGIKSSKNISIALEASEWGQLISLCNKAVKISATTWIVVGTMSEGSKTDDPTQMSISAGPGLNIILTSPKKGSYSYILQKTDYPQLQGALQKVKAFFAK